MEASDRPKQAKHLPTSRKVQNGNTKGHQGLSDSRGMGVVHRPVGHLRSYPHPPRLKEVPKVLPRFSGVPVHLPPFRPSHGPTSLDNVCKGSEADSPQKGSQSLQYLDDWLIRALSQEEAQVNTQTVVDLTQSLRWITNQEKSKLKPPQVFSFVDYKYHLDSALVKPTQERWL